MKRGNDELVAPLLAEFNEKHRANMLREHLRLARITRTRLVEETDTTMLVNFRFSCDWGITWLALGRGPRTHQVACGA